MEKEPAAGTVRTGGGWLLHNIETARTFSSPTQGSPKTELSARRMHEVRPRHVSATIGSVSAALQAELTINPDSQLPLGVP